jgi:stress-induced morphogen
MIKMRMNGHKKSISFSFAGHAGNPGGDGETHFNVNIVSTAFQNKSPIARHRMVYEILDFELKNGVHALSLKCRTPEEEAKHTVQS